MPGQSSDNGEMAHGHGSEDAEKPVQDIAVGERPFEQEKRRHDGNAQDAGDQRQDKSRVLGDEMESRMDYESDE